MLFGNSAGNFGGSAVRRPFEHDSAAAMSYLIGCTFTEFQADSSKLVGKRCRFDI